jgi:hypothetical protein
MTGTKKMNALVLVGCMLMALSGCTRYVVAGAALGGAAYGTYKYNKGNLKGNYSAPVAEVWEATQAALTEIGVQPKEKSHDAFGGEIKAELYDGKSLKVKLVRIADNLTEVGVKVGTFGDQARSELVHSEIAKQLKSYPSADAPDKS